ncbi:alpha/beta fold hydrolase [Pendulispora brunnea]|uniref:Alpha/beta fold hydrolase n=1 Tax=Pendulispora brunnea TaxID=2905690 RepID=A0ABZ2KCE3_9BACT
MGLGKIVRFAVGAVGVVYAAAAALAFAKQRAILFPAGAPRDVVMPEGQLVRISAEGREVFALHAPAKDADAPTLVFFHGNGEQLADLPVILRLFATYRLGAYAIEYPGYGLAHAQSVSEAAVYEAAEAGLVHLEKELGIPRERIVLVGQSIGSGAATEMARRGHGSKLVLLSPYTSIAEMARVVLPMFPGSLMVRDRFDNASKAPGIDIPVLILHGTADELIPVTMGKKLATLFPQAQLALVEGGHHGDLFFRNDDFVPATIARFATFPATPQNAGR